MRIVENKRRTEQVIGRILLAHARKEFPFNLSESQPPQLPQNMPPNGFRSDQEKACFFFFLCFWMAGGILSDQAVRGLSKLYARASWLFDPHQAQHGDSEQIYRLLVDAGLTFKAKMVKHWWPENARRLVVSCDGDPRRLFDDVVTFEEACAKIRNHKIKTKKRSPGGAPGFIGFQEKMVSMLTYFLMDAGFIDPFHFPPPIDFHFLRFLLAHEILKMDTRETHTLGAIQAKARKILLEYSLRHGIGPIQLADAIWGFARAMCDQHPGNATSKEEYRARGTKLTAYKVIWDNTQIQAYLRSCGACPVEKTCRWNIPSADYYVRGRILLRGERDKPPLFKQLL